MRKTCTIVMFVLSVTLYGQSIAVDGTLVIAPLPSDTARNDKIVKIRGFAHGADMTRYAFRVKYNDTETTIPLSDVAVLRVVSGNLNDKDRTAKAVLTTKNGKSFEVSAVESTFESFEGQALVRSLQYLVSDEISGKVVINKVPWYAVRQIILEATGDVMVDPQTNEKFPPDYRYNPYTGSRLVPGTHGK